MKGKISRVILGCIMTVFLLSGLAFAEGLGVMEINTGDETISANDTVSKGDVNTPGEQTPEEPGDETSNPSSNPAVNPSEGQATNPSGSQEVKPQDEVEAAPSNGTLDFESEEKEATPEEIAENFGIEVKEEEKIVVTHTVVKIDYTKIVYQKAKQQGLKLGKFKPIQNASFDISAYVLNVLTKNRTPIETIQGSLMVEIPFAGMLNARYKVAHLSDQGLDIVDAVYAAGVLRFPVRYGFSPFVVLVETDENTALVDTEAQSTVATANTTKSNEIKVVKDTGRVELSPATSSKASQKIAPKTGENFTCIYVSLLAFLSLMGICVNLFITSRNKVRITRRRN